MEQDFLTKTMAIAAGISAGGGFLIWFAKLMAGRLIKQYDDKHAEHEKKLSALSEKFADQLTDMKIKLAKLEPLVAGAISIRDDLKAVEGEVAVLEHKDQEREKDINTAFGQIRLIAKKLEH